MESETKVQILDEAVCISLYANALGKAMNPCPPPHPAMSKIVGQTGFFSLGYATSLERKFKPSLLYFQIDLVPNLAHEVKAW